MGLPGVPFKAVQDLACPPVCSSRLSLLPPAHSLSLAEDVRSSLCCAGCSWAKGPPPPPLSVSCPPPHLSSSQPHAFLPLQSCGCSSSVFSSWPVHASELSPCISHTARSLWCVSVPGPLSAWHIAHAWLNVCMDSWCQRFQKRTLYLFFFFFL